MPATIAITRSGPVATVTLRRPEVHNALNPAMIARALTTFASDPDTVPGRFNVMEWNGVEVVVDYAHNIEAMKALSEALDALGRRHTVMMLTLPGDRPDDDLIATMRTTLPAVDEYVLYDSAERRAGLAVVAAIATSAGIAGVEAIRRLVSPAAPDHLVALALAGGIGFAGNYLAAVIRTRAGRRLDSPALIADGRHARADAYVSLGVVASAAVVALGLPMADPVIGLAITAVILRITWQSWRTVREPRL